MNAPADRIAVRGLAAALLGIEPSAVPGVIRSLMGPPAQAGPEARAFRGMLEPAIWRRIGEVIQGVPAGNALELIDLCRAALALDPDVRERTRAYGASWRRSGMDALRATLGRLPDLGEACRFLSTFKPRGPIVTPPLCLTAELLLRAHGRAPERDAVLLERFLTPP